MTQLLQIFIVNSDTENLEKLTGILSDDYDIISFSSAESCLNYLNHASSKRQAPPFLIILGVDLSKKEGCKTCQSIKRNPSRKADFDLNVIKIIKPALTLFLTNNL